MEKTRSGDVIASGPAPAPDSGALAILLDEYAPLGPAPLVPEVRVFQGRGLLELWGAAERLAGRAVPPPFWGYPWPGGIALARTVLDHPELVAGARVLDLGTGGGVAALAAKLAGAREVVANDRDPWAIATALLAAERQGLELTPLLADIAGGADRGASRSGEDGGRGGATDDPDDVARPRPVARGVRGGGIFAGSSAEYDVVLCGDLSYERSVAPKIRAFLERAYTAGALVLVADAGRAYFDPTGFTLLAEYVVPVPHDLEGARERTARVYRLG